MLELHPLVWESSGTSAERSVHGSRVSGTAADSSREWVAAVRPLDKAHKRARRGPPGDAARRREEAPHSAGAAPARDASRRTRAAASTDEIGRAHV